MNRIKPYPPNFNRIAAKIIEPSSGASTWALGSHKWSINIGIFAKKAVINKIGMLVFCIIISDIENDWLYDSKIILTKRGSEAEMVYIIK